MSIAPRHRFLVLIAAISLGVAACGADETIDAAVPAPETMPNDASGEDAMDQDGNSEENANPGFTPMTPRTDLVSLQLTTPDEVLIDPDNDERLLIRFQGAAEPCSGAAVTVTETDTAVTVLLETGLDPNAAAMSCIAQVFEYEIAVPLDASLGDRNILAEAVG